MKPEAVRQESYADTLSSFSYPPGCPPDRRPGRATVCPSQTRQSSFMPRQRDVAQRQNSGALCRCGEAVSGSTRCGARRRATRYQTCVRASMPRVQRCARHGMLRVIQCLIALPPCGMCARALVLLRSAAAVAASAFAMRCAATKVVRTPFACFSATRCSMQQRNRSATIDVLLKPRAGRRACCCHERHTALYVSIRCYRGAAVPTQYGAVDVGRRTCRRL